MTQKEPNAYDAVVIGGGAAGLNGATMLARSRRSVLVVDAGEPRNAAADGVHGLLGHDGIPPRELLERGRREVRAYGGEIVFGTVVSAERDGDRFAVTTADGRAVTASRLLVTTGLIDELPKVAGLRERWGHDVIHCPYCHGWEVRDQRIAILGTGPMSVHQALLFRQLSDDVVYVVHADGPVADETSEQLSARGVRVAQGPALSVLVQDDRLVGLRLADGVALPLDVVVVAPRMVARVGFLGALGLTAVEHPMGVGERIPADSTGRTDVPGVWVAGNVTDMTAQVGASAAAGAMAGAQINADLVMEETARAVEAARASAQRSA